MENQSQQCNIVHNLFLLIDAHQHYFLYQRIYVESKKRCIHKTMWGQKAALTKTTFGSHPVAFGVFSGHAEAMLVLESMRHDNRAEGVSVDFRRQGGREFSLGLVHVKFWRSLRLLAECCCSGSCDYMVMFLYFMITIFQGIYSTNEK